MIRFVMLVIFLTSSAGVVKATVIDQSTCGVSKFCFSYPFNCSSSSPDCIFVTYQYDEAASVFRMELSGGKGAGEEYTSMAWGLSPRMRDADTYVCTGTALLTGVIREINSDPVMDKQLPEAIEDVTVATRDGVAVCSFSRRAVVGRTVSEGLDHDFDLVNNAYYLLYAKGKMKPGNELAYHQKGAGRGKTHYKVALTKKSMVGECGKSFGCFSSPENCEPGSKDCKFITWFYYQHHKTFEFTAVSGRGTGGWYQSFGFADTPEMKDVDLYYCTGDKVASSVVRDLHSRPEDDPDSTGLLVEGQQAVMDDVLMCKFTRPAAINKTISGGLHKTFDIVKENFYVQHSAGVVSSTGGITKHHGHATYGASSSKINFTIHAVSPHDDDDGGSRFRMIKAHAIFMLIAWITCINLGSVMARHGKPLFPSKLIGEIKVWFQLHRGLMSVGVLFTLIGTGLIFIALDRYEEDAGAHAILGLIVLALAFLNVYMALLRPGPDSSRRTLFNWAHRCCGLISRVLATACIYLGFNFPIMEMSPHVTHVMTGFVVNQILVELLLEAVPFFHLVFDKFNWTRGDPKETTALYGIFSYLALSNISFLIGFCAMVSSV